MRRGAALDSFPPGAESTKSGDSKQKCKNCLHFSSQGLDRNEAAIQNVLSALLALSAALGTRGALGCSRLLSALLVLSAALGALGFSLFLSVALACSWQLLAFSNRGQKRPADPHQPNLYLEPKWLRCSPQRSASLALFYWRL